MLFAYLYLIRVPLVCGAFIAGMRYFALRDSGTATALLAGIFDVTPWAALLIGICATWFTVSCVVSADLTLGYAHDRFDVLARPSWVRSELRERAKTESTLRWVLEFFFQDIDIQAAILIFAYWVISIYLLIGLFHQSSPWTGWAALLAYTVAYILLMWIMRGRKTAKKYDRKGLLFVNSARLCGLIQRLTNWTPGGYSRGKDEVPPYPEYAARMISYHAGALLGTALSFVFYIVMFFLGRCVPALACVLLMVTFLNWVLSAFAFFLDRFHVPLLLIAVAIVAYTGTWPEADHTFDVFDVSANLPAPEALASIDPQRFIAIAASGGGIHAAGWTTQVLGGLYKELPSIELRKRLAHSIRVISPVSGGSVGSLYLLNAYRFADFREGRFGPEQIESYLFRPSVESSLEPMVQRMVFEDWWRTLMPGIPIATDRGRAAEQAWRDSIHIKEAAPSDDWLKQPLSEWAKLAASGVAPAVLFNTTIVDTGERAIFATADFSKSTKRHGRWTLRELYGKPLDTSLVTAARLSATFPVVSPSARASGVWPTRYRYHFVDGGYYDNYGMATLVEWLDDVFHARPSHGPIMLLQIKDSQDEEVASPRPAQGESGFLSQTFAPVFTIFRFRDTGQVAHGDLESKLLSASLANRIRYVRFAWPYPSSPLSWHLTNGDKQGLHNAFTLSRMTESKRQVCAFLAGDDKLLIRQCAASFGAPPQ